MAKRILIAFIYVLFIYLALVVLNLNYFSYYIVEILIVCVVFFWPCFIDFERDEKISNS